MSKIKVVITAFLFFLSSVIVLGTSNNAAAATIVNTFSISNGDITATLDSDGYLEITGSGTMPDALPFYSYRTQIKTVYVGPGISNIGEYNFSGCANLTSISGMEGVTSIGSKAFNGCNISNLYIGSNVESISNKLFGDDTYLNSISYEVAPGNQTYSSSDGVLFNKDKTTLIAYPINKTNTSYTVPSSVTKIDTRAFYKQSFLRTINLNRVEMISGWAFSEMASLQEMTIPSTITEIYSDILAYCPALTSLTYNANNSNGYVACDICRGCTALRTVDLRGSSVREIKYNSFRDCTALTNVYLNDNITYIDDYCFNGCSSLTTMDFPTSVIYIYGHAFEGSGITPDKFPSWINYIDGTNCSYSQSALVDVTGTYSYSLAAEVVTIVNQKRAEEGLSPLEVDDRLTEFAMMRAAEQVALFGHFRPWGLLLFSDVSGIGGENCARGSSTAIGTMNQWMNSSGHRDNIMSESFQSIGVGCFIYNGSYYWVQVFSSKSSAGSSSHSDVTKTHALQVDLTKCSSLKITNVPTNNLVVDQQVQLNGRLTYSVDDTAYSFSPDPANFLWKSSDSSVISVNSDGSIIANKAGTATISASFSRYNITDVSASIELTVRQDDINSESVTVGTIANQAYAHGEPIKPLPIIKDGGTRLYNGTDYWLEYSDNTDIGTATITIHGKGYYFGTRKITFEITRIPFSYLYLTVKGIEKREYDYTGQPLTFDIVVTDISMQSALSENTDYTVTYTGDNIKPGRFTVKIQGMGIYSSDVLTYQIKINSLTFAREDVNISEGVIVRNGKRLALNPDAVSVAVYGITLQREIHYNVQIIIYSESRVELSVYGVGGYSGGYNFDITEFVPAPTATPTVTVSPTPVALPSVTPTVKPSISPSATPPNKPSATPTKAASVITNITATPNPTQKPPSKATVTPTAFATPVVTATRIPDDTNISFHKDSAVIISGETCKLNVFTSGNGVIAWTSSDTNIASVDKDGNVIGKQAGSVTVTATLGGKSASCTLQVLYKDVTNPKDFWYYPTNYLTNKGVVKGYDKQTKFKPANMCTRAQMVTFIWRLQGEPEPDSSTCKFSDVKKADYFYTACIWGNENHIVEGYKDGTFGPQIVCARKHAVTFLWRLAGKPEPESSVNKFSDVKKSNYFYEATLWASEKKILAGYSDGTFRPDGDCLRRQMVTFLYKYDKYINGKG